MGYGAMFSMENLENQTFKSKNHNLGHEWDTNVKLALVLPYLFKFYVSLKNNQVVTLC